MRNLWGLVIALFLIDHLEASRYDKLMDAVHSGNLRKVKRYVKRVGRRKINKPNNFGETPLSSAATGSLIPLFGPIAPWLHFVENIFIDSR